MAQQISVKRASAETLLVEWLDFVKEDYPKIASDSKWSHVAKSYRVSMKNVKRNQQTPSLIYFIIARSFVEKLHDGEALSVSVDFKAPLDHFLREEFYFKVVNGKSNIRSLSKWADVKRQEKLTGRIRNLVDKSIDSIVSSIAESLSSRLTSGIELSMHVFIFSLLFKFESENTDKDILRVEKPSDLNLK